ncbi:merozoite surface protein 9-like [Procambarus clarkii]|uniref:merozoite surface protein 9-like n=1 Tax=Procambarus clarkii TaxID=6728 RepID=UPI0037428F40
MAQPKKNHVKRADLSRVKPAKIKSRKCLRDTIVEGYKTNVEKAISKINLIIEDHKKLLAQREEEKAKREEEKAKREEEKAKREEEKAKREERKDQTGGGKGQTGGEKGQTGGGSLKPERKWQRRAFKRP